MSFNMTNLQLSNNPTFMAYIQNDEIYSYDGQKWGVTIQKYNEVEQGLIKCKNRLIELGEIKVPKTQEQIIQEQSEMIEQQRALLNDLINKMGAQNGYTATNIEPDTEGQTTTGDTNSSTANKKNKSSSNK